MSAASATVARPSTASSASASSGERVAAGLARVDLEQPARRSPRCARSAPAPRRRGARVLTPRRSTRRRSRRSRRGRPRRRTSSRAPRWGATRRRRRPARPCRSPRRRRARRASSWSSATSSGANWATVGKNGPGAAAVPCGSRNRQRSASGPSPSAAKSRSCAVSASATDGSAMWARTSDAGHSLAKSAVAVSRRSCCSSVSVKSTCAPGQARGRPSTRWAMMLRWISDDPPAIVFAKFRKKPCTQRPFSSPRSGSETMP